MDKVKKVIFLICCGVLVSVVGCSGNTAPSPTESPPTTVSETIKTETPTETTPPITAVERTEKEKEPVPTESADQATEPTVTGTAPTTTAKPTEETKRTEPTKATEPSAAEKTEHIEETPSETEEPQEEIYVGIQWPEVDPADIEKLVIEKINDYRIAQGDTAATMLPGLTEVARYRANELTENFSHTSPRDACNELKYGEFVDMALYGLTAEDSYYQGFNREAIGMGDWFGTAESMSDRIADGFHHSKGHWSYVGSSKYPYIAVGVTKANVKWYVCICMSEENYGG
ncbi:MAG: hypothetical protein DBY04_01875 [Clostridiales bacterium]|nr:MAG: hypothetical protein DBY04_01875 [Clostridiales bacterium]